MSEAMPAEAQRYSAEAQPRYSVVQRLLHWLIALLVLGALAGGTVLWAYGFQGLNAAFGLEMTNTIYTAHKSVGLLILALMLVRLGVRSRRGAPPPPASLSPAVATLARTTHLAFYVLLLAMPVLGWLATDAGDFPVQFFAYEFPQFIPKNEALAETLYTLHGWTGVAIAVVVALHIAGALRHRFALKDGVMRRIALP